MQLCRILFIHQTYRAHQNSIQTSSNRFRIHSSMMSHTGFWSHSTFTFMQLFAVCWERTSMSGRNSAQLGTTSEEENRKLSLLWNDSRSRFTLSGMAKEFTF